MQFSGPNKKLFVVVLAGLVLKLCFLPIVDTIDPDVFSRIYISEYWLSHPEWYTDGIWLPFHFYLTGAAIWISGNHVYGPMVLHILFSVATLIPLFHFTKREFNEKGAYLVVFAYLLSPIVFRFSYQALSGIPNAFFVAMALNYLSLALNKGKRSAAILSGLFITFAAGLRYESWILIMAFGLMILIRMDRRTLVYFLLPASVFPVIWMTGNYLVHGHVLYGVTGVYNSETVIADNSNVTSVQFIIRSLFFPLSLFLLFSPILMSQLIVHSLKRWRSGFFDLNRALWLLPFVILLVAFIYKAQAGTLLLQHRFNILLILLLLPFLAILTEAEWKGTWRKRIALLGFMMLPFVQLWFYPRIENLVGVESEWGKELWKQRVDGFAYLNPIPQLIDPEATKQQKVIKELLVDRENAGLIIDFDNWITSYNLALNCSEKLIDVNILNPSMGPLEISGSLEPFINKYDKGVLLCKCDSKLLENGSLKNQVLSLYLNDTIRIKVDRHYQKDGIGIYSYDVSRRVLDTVFKDQPICPQDGTREYYRMVIKKDPSMLNSLYYTKFLSGKDFDQVLEEHAQWFVENQN